MSGRIFGLPPRGFDRGTVQLASTGYIKTGFPLDCTYAGGEGRAEPGSVAKGDSLIVCFQDTDLSSTGLGVWLTVENRGEEACRWFGCTLTAYAQPMYANIEPEHYQTAGGHLMFDLYPGEQYTCYYFFPFGPNIAGPKFLTCNSWDRPMSFWWARGA